MVSNAQQPPATDSPPRDGAGRGGFAWQGVADMVRAYAEVLRPPPPLSPSAFAAVHRRLHAIYCTERPGMWDNTVFPCQAPIMDMAEEAMKTGKKGIVEMKAGQVGGSDAAINMLFWLKTYYPGPMLFMTSTEKVAGEFGRERFKLVIEDMEPLRKKYIPNPRGDIYTKRFIDGKIHLSGGQSVYNLQSTPYRFVGIDELDSLVENLGGEGDPVKLAEVRTDSFTGQTLLVAYAHPTSRQRGAGKIYYELSDQRRGFVRHECGSEFHLQWEHVRPIPEGEMTLEQAQADADCYHYVCPGCGAYIRDEERVAMVRKVVYKSTLDPEVARKKNWIGVHTSQLYSPAKTIKSLAQRWIECLQDPSPDNAKKVFVNKVLGECFEPKLQEIELATLRRSIVQLRRANDPEFYLRGQVPPGVRFLTAGQDSRSTQFHWAIWGWGLRRSIGGNLYLCGWLIDWGEIARPYSLVFSEAEYHVFDDLIYRRAFAATRGDRLFNVKQCGHDIGYAPTQIPIVTYCRNHRHRAIATKGASETHSSAVNAPYARWGSALTYKVGDKMVKDEGSRHLQINTFMIKTDFYGWLAPENAIDVLDRDLAGNTLGSRKVSRLSLPGDVDELFLEQTKNETLAAGKKKGEMIWKKKGANHIADCNTNALGLAYNLDPFQDQKTAEEAQGGAGGGRRGGRSYEDAGGGEEGDRGGGEDPSMG